MKEMTLGGVRDCTTYAVELRCRLGSEADNHEISNIRFVYQFSKPAGRIKHKMKSMGI